MEIYMRNIGYVLAGDALSRPFISRHPRIHLFGWFLAWKEAFTPHRKAYD
jgi:hypothetical protein